MNPVIGLDVAKGESQVQAYLDRREPYKSSFKVAHTLDGLKCLHDFLLEVERGLWCPTTGRIGSYRALPYTGSSVFRGEKLLNYYC